MVAAGSPRLGLIALHRKRADRDDRRCLEIGIGLDAPRCLVAVDDRQLDVHEDEIGAPGLRIGHGLRTVHRLADVIA